MATRLLKRGDRVVDILYGSTGTVVGVPPIPPELDLYRMYTRDRVPWALIEWDYTEGTAFWARQSDLKLLTLSS
jgi:hypothetical protein